MLLCLDIGNSHLHGGVFDDGNNNNKLLLQFRHDAKQIGSSDQLGIFIRNVLRENNIDYTEITKIGIASVVPVIDYTARSACVKYLKLEPLFLTSDIKTGIIIKTNTPNEVGADFIADAIAAKQLYPDRDILTFDLGTATKCSYLNKNGEFLGATIAPGMRLMMESLQQNTAKLFGVELVQPTSAIGKATKPAIQSGIFYSQLGFIIQIIEQVTKEYDLNSKPLVIATGGFSHLFAESKIFDIIVPELALLGIKHMLELNTETRH
jgi:type III pantothenate kinase